MSERTLKKRITALWVSFLSAFLVCACGNNEAVTFETDEERAGAEETISGETDSGGDILDTPSDGPSPEAEETLMYVFVSGAVRFEGVYTLPEGARIADALEKAGGFSEDADTAAVNLAARLTDGMQVYFPTKEETEGREYFSEETGETESDGRININTADSEELMTLSGIGQAKADAIIAYREENGPFGSVEEICQVKGIKGSVYEKIREYITVG